MTSYLHFLALLITLLGLFGAGEGIRCYQCDSDRDPNCRDPFYRNVGTVECRDQSGYGSSYGLCRKMVYRQEYGRIHVQRGCATTTGGGAYNSGGGSCGFSNSNDGNIIDCTTCATDECNSASISTPWSVMATTSMLWIGKKLIH